MQSDLGRVILAVSLALSCSRQVEKPPGPRDAGPPLSAVQRVSRAAVADALSLAQKSPCDRATYVELRRALARVLPLSRYEVSMAADLMVGPRVAISEGGGELGALDRALAAKDCTAAATHRVQLEGALTLISADLAGRVPSERAILRGLSDAAFELGAEALASTPGTPEEEDARAADLDGTARTIRELAQAVADDHQVKNEVAEPAQRVRELIAVSHDRGDLALATGRLGVALRSLGKKVGHDLPLLYPTLSPQPISALSLPRPHVVADPDKAALGGALFADPRLSRGGARACTGCHDPKKSWSDGRRVPTTLGAPLTRNTPSLSYVALAASLHWDGRLRTADAQALNVIHARAEMGLGTEELLSIVRTRYAQSFAKAFPDGVTERNVGHALAAFEATLLPARAPIDRFARGDATALGVDDRRGLEVFAGKGRCARCHVPPYFGGSRPPDFTAPIYAALGVPTAPGKSSLDPDRGRALVTAKTSDEHSFRTPTLRNVSETAPYFHNGAFATLEEVIDFYDRGGGRALGFEVPNQDPDVRPLALTAEERRVLLVFLRHALHDE